MLPGTARTDKRAQQWHETSTHEAGHVVMALVSDLPIHDVRIRRTLFGHVVGHTRATPPGRALYCTSLQDLGYTIGGPEAEAIWIADRDGISLDRARRKVKRWATRDDFATIADRLADPDHDVTRGQAFDEANAELCANWDCVEQVAAALREHGRLSARDIARLT